MSRRPLQVLALAADPDGIQLLQEAFEELRELQFTRPWLAPVEFGVAESPAEALSMLSTRGYDAVIADLDLLGGSGHAFLRRLQEGFPELAVLFLVDGGQEGEGFSLVRRGAQDCLLKGELDCLPLARSLRFAVERARIRAALRANCLFDPLTGLYAERAFFDLAGRYLRIAARAGQPAEVRLFALRRREGAGPSCGGGADLALITLAETLKARFCGLEVAGRISALEIALVAARTGEGGQGEDLPAAAVRAPEGDGEKGESTPGGDYAVVTAVVGAAPGRSLEELIAAARAAMCENRRARPVTLR